MENEMYQDELEQFLRNEVKQHRMYPSDHVWKNIRTEMHGYRSWPALTFISLFIITALTLSTLIGNQPLHEQPQPRNSSPVPAEETGKPAQVTVSVRHSHDETYFNKMAPGHLTAQTFENELSARSYAAGSTVTATVAPVMPMALLSIPKMTARELAAPEHTLTADIAVTPAETAVASSESYTAIKASAEEHVSTQNKKISMYQPTDKILNDQVIVRSKELPRRNSRFGFQFYITPSTSYRRLSDQKVKEVIQPAAVAGATGNVPLSSITGDVNNVVRHRPAVGLELGFAAVYNLTKRLKFKTGVQLNVRQYFIETFQTRQSDLTSLSLINNRGVETIAFYSPYNNNTGYKSTQLQNRVYQLSVPLGIQWDAIQGRRWGVNTEASVQPTMMLNNNSYVLSTDYKHYTDGSQFMRKWNVNTSVGFNLTYRAGTSSWQLGPQIRYQHLSTYSNAYPIKEHLMDYGIRLGFTKQIN